MREARLHPAVLLNCDPLGAGAEDGDVAAVHQVPEDPGVWVERRPVVEDEGAAGGEDGDLVN